MFELVLRADEALVEPLTETLINALNALSASVEDADAAGPREQALFGEPGVPVARHAWHHSRIVALFAQEADAQTAAALLVAQHGTHGLQLEALRPVAEQDWVRLTQSQFQPVAVTESFWIVPSWHAVPAEAVRVIRLDPGLAFGTGTHPTTRMCLRWIARQATALAPQWTRVLDYGCGSGVLAIAAALHGAQGVDAVDIDPAALQAARANADANRVALRCCPPELAEGAYALVLANILATPLRVLAPLLSARVAAGGRLVLAGILERQAADLQQAYAPWLELSVDDTEDGWILMTARRGA
ncbi:MAG: 50S ribosomal protein L11 methyltransferase [Burkholderiaceae bacterium]|nr:50S ribosomal protein L11 methyltransferase [Burkholderiaceae bacterium]